jgi:hypothetical protein
MRYGAATVRESVLFSQKPIRLRERPSIQLRQHMRAFSLAVTLLAALAWADDAPVSPRSNPSDYPAHDSLKTAAIAATIVPSEQVKKLFSADTAKAYVVVEVAVYPEAGNSLDVDLIDFALRTGEQVVRASEPRDIGTAWPSAKNPSIGSRGPNVTAETGVIVDRETDPITGRPRTSVGTYESVAVSNYPRNDPPPPPPSKSSGDVDAKIRKMALPQGPAKAPVAGYLYFRYRARKQDSFTLNYTNDDGSIDLKFPSK